MMEVCYKGTYFFFENHLIHALIDFFIRKMPKFTKSEKSRNRFSSIISGDEPTPSSRQRIVATSPPIVTENFGNQKLLEKIFKQNLEILKNMDKLEERLEDIEESLKAMNEINVKPEDENFVKVIIKFF